MNTIQQKIGLLRRQNRGYTLVEMIIAISLVTIMTTGTIMVFVMCMRYWNDTSLDMAATRDAELTLQKMVYGVGTNLGLRATSWITNTTAGGGGWSLKVSNYYGYVWYNFNPTSKTISFSNTTYGSVLCSNVLDSNLTLGSNTLGITISVGRSEGMFSASNTVATAMKLRIPVKR